MVGCNFQLVSSDSVELWLLGVRPMTLRTPLLEPNDRTRERSPVIHLRTHPVAMCSYIVVCLAKDNYSERRRYSDLIGHEEASSKARVMNKCIHHFTLSSTINHGLGKVISAPPQNAHPYFHLNTHIDYVLVICHDLFQRFYVRGLVLT